MPTKKQLEDKISMLNDALEASLSLSPERDHNFFTGGLSNLYEGRSNWDRKKVFSESMRAWRVNPIARRIVRLMTSFVIGKGIAIKSDDPKAQAFLTEWWSHPLNKFNRNVKRWKDEDTRTGNLFFLFNVQQDGMTIIRAVPAEQIEDIETREHDVEQEVKYWKDESKTESYDAYNETSEEAQTLFMMHFASNQPVGSPWGEADLSPLLVWIGRFSSWLEDRVRLNRYRTAFMYVIRGTYDTEGERSAREKHFNANPPKSGSILVLNTKNSEDWGILSANLDSFDATLDGQNIKKMISAGIGFPMHWLSEPEGSTQTTAEAAGTPTFRTLEESQNDFFEMMIELAQVALKVKGIRLAEGKKVWIEGPDITERDNASLALALGRAYPNLSDLYDREAIEPKEFMRLTYKMFAEVWDESKTPNIKRKPLVKTTEQQPAAVEDTKTDPGDTKEESSNQNREEDFARLDSFFARLDQKPVEAPTINITNQIPEQSAPVVNLTNQIPAPIVNLTNQVDVPSVTVQNQIPEQPAPIVNVENQIDAPIVHVENQIPTQEAPIVLVTNEVKTPVVNLTTPKAAAPIVNVAAPQVTVTNDVKIPRTTETSVIKRDSEGRAERIEKTFEQDDENE